MKAHPLKSEGARMERKAVRAHLARLDQRYRRARTAGNEDALDVALEVVHAFRGWVLGRQKRYDAKPGGLGRKAKAR